MIADLLNPGFVGQEREKMIQRFRELAERLDKLEAEAVRIATKFGFTAEELRTAAKMLEDEAVVEQEKENEAAFIPSSPLTCMMQTRFEELAWKADMVEPATTAKRGLASETTAITEVRLKPVPDAKRGAISLGTMVDGEDFRYALDGGVAVAAKLLGKLVSGIQNEEPIYNEKPAKKADLGNEARLILFGDWASGIERAQALSKQIAHLANTEAGGRTQHLVHLGDTYYSGWPSEYEERFLPLWPDCRAVTATHWTLNGNHDMYSGGRGYFETCLSDDIFRPHHADENGNPSSFFLIENDHWQVFGLDSAFHSPQLRGMNGAIDDSQAKFVRDNIDRKKGVILLTHHQLFSARKSEGNSLQIKAKLADVWPHITGWIWGHEHRCVVYKSDWTRKNHDGLGFAMCLGNSGVPVLVDKKPQQPFDSIEWEFGESLPVGSRKFLRFAFATLDFSATHPEKIIVTVHGQRQYPFEIVKR